MKEKGFTPATRLNTLLELLAGGKYSYLELEEALDCNRATICNCINKLLKQGHIIKKETISKKTYFYLQSPVFEAMNFDHIRKYHILRTIQKYPIPQKHINDYFSLSSELSSSKAGDNITKTFIDCGTTKFYDLFKELILEKDIAKTETNIYYPTGKNLSILMNLSEEEAYELYYELLSLNPGIYGYEHLCQLLENLKAYTDLFSDFTLYEENFLIYGKKLENFKYIEEFIHTLPKDFKESYVEITFTDNQGNINNFLVGIGLILYSIEKDTIYLIGEYLQPLGFPYIIINVKSILSIKSIAMPCHIFLSARYKKIFTEMLSISVSEPKEISLTISIFGNIVEKFKAIHQQRTNSKLTIHKKYLIFQDTVRGEMDLLPLLRSLGRAVIKVSPPELAESLQKSKQLSITRYEELANYEF